jgi:cell division protein FtsW
MQNNHTKTIITLVGSIILIGIIILASVSTIYSQQKLGTPYYFLTRQIIYFLIGIFGAYIIYKIDLEKIKKYSLFVVLANTALIAAVFLPGIGWGSGCAKRWIILGPLQLQPAELLKFTFIIFAATWIAKAVESLSKNKKFALDNFRHLGICCGVFLVIAIILKIQPDISSLAVLLSIFFIMLFVSGLPLKYFTGLITLGLAGLVLIILTVPHTLKRVQTFFNPTEDPLGAGYQLRQAAIAIGSGGLFGLGLGMSKQKMGFLPETLSDTIFATFAEETGFIGCIILVSLFLALAWTGFSIAKSSKDKFSSLAATGIVSWISIQAFVNISAMLGIVPLAGIALPFISYGGSHLMAELFAIGLLLNITKKS